MTAIAMNKYATITVCNPFDGESVGEVEESSGKQITAAVQRAATAAEEFRHSTPAERRVILAMVLGLVCNAVVFGGLSAPVDRYQARVVWLVPACLVLLCAAIMARKTQNTSAAGDVPDVL